jgi:hypothetical protein
MRAIAVDIRDSAWGQTGIGPAIADSIHPQMTRINHHCPELWLAFSPNRDILLCTDIPMETDGSWPTVSTGSANPTKENLFS